MREALLPGTDALPTNTVEIRAYHGKYLVRVRSLGGSTQRETYPLTEAGRDQAHEWFLAQAARLRQETLKFNENMKKGESI